MRAKALTIICLFCIIILQTSLGSHHASHPPAVISTSGGAPVMWLNNIYALKSYNYSDGSVIRPILIRGKVSTTGLSCGFFCNGLCDSYLFAIFIVQLTTSLDIDTRYQGYPQVVWSANRNNPVKENATMQLTSNGDFVLRDVGGELVWSTNTMYVSALNLTESGNLLLLGVDGSVVWQSFDYPTDSILPLQYVSQGLKFKASVSNTNFSEGLYSLFISDLSYLFYIESDPPLIYHTSPLPMHSSINFGGPIHNYAKLLPDGHLRIYQNRLTQWDWVDSGDFLAGMPNSCEYPMVCGEYGVCQKGQCSCPLSTYFTQKNATQPNLGCSHITPLTCNYASHFQGLVEVKATRYFTFRVDINNTDPNSCKEACLANCSCRASMFRYASNPSIGDCYLPSQIFSLIDTNDEPNGYHNYSVFLKVQQSNISILVLGSSRAASLPIVLGCTLVGFISLFLISVLIVLMFKKRRTDVFDADFCVNIASGMPGRFSLEDLKLATHNFNMKLGEGGFGCVYKGSLEDGTKVAVKCVDGIGQKNSFLTEVGSIGNIHHVNLVRLVGYCAEKSHRLLVYEYMPNGSLDNWIYSQENSLDWKCRKKIVVDIAKGLTYLHEDCSQKIIHLDVKPQNILLDENFNAKLADFGISKLLSRDQSKVVTSFRGTPGYMAPEWLSSIITEKADVYSFGVVVMEIVCGRRVFDCSLLSGFGPMHLLSVLNQNAKEGKWLDMVSFCNDDMKSNEAEVVKMMQVAAWCLQNDFSSRPSMSVVVKVLEGGIGGVDVDLSNLDYNFISPMIYAPCMPESHLVQHHTLQCPEFSEDHDTLQFPEVLSGPR